MAETIRKTPPAADPETTNGAVETASGRSERGKSLIDHLRANPGIVWDELGEQIDALIEALIVARLQIEGHAGATRQEIALDLYDEELIRSTPTQRRSSRLVRSIASPCCASGQIE
jgi:hypothetical protein